LERSGSFHYPPPHDPHKEIKLLRILPAAADDDGIACVLITVERDNASSNAALSYTWGDPLPAIDARRCIITRNCWYAMWQLRYHATAECYWVDFLCINQEDIDK